MCLDRRQSPRVRAAQFQGHMSAPRRRGGLFTSSSSIQPLRHVRDADAQPLSGTTNSVTPVSQAKYRLTQLDA